MPVNANLRYGPNDSVVHCAQPFGKDTLLETTNYFQTHGIFKTAQISTATTTTVADPPLGGYIVVTNILISAARKVGETVTIEFDDGTNTEILFTALLSNLELQENISIPHGWRGWRDAALKIVTDNTAVVSVTVGYVKLENGEQYGVWDARR